MPEVILCSSDLKVSEYKGIKDTGLQFFGSVRANMKMNDCISNDMSTFVLSDSTIKSSVVLGRDVINSFELELMSRDSSDSVRAINEILSINVEIELAKITESLDINPEIEFNTQSFVRELFSDQYLIPERPEVPHVKMKLSLTLTDDRAFNFNPRRLSFEEKVQLEKILERLLLSEIIRPSESPYASPIVLTKKKNGKMRLCIDYWVLNKITVRDNYPLPYIEDQIDKLRNKRFCTLFDLKDGFHYISMADDSVKYTAFVTPPGQFKYLKIPFGLKTAPPKFQRFVNTVLSSLTRSGGVLAYLDDFLIATETFERHLFVLEQVFKLLVENKLELRLDKCHFFQTEIEYLGYHVAEKGIKRKKGVLNYPEAKNVREIQGFVHCLDSAESCVRY